MLATRRSMSPALASVGIAAGIGAREGVEQVNEVAAEAHFEAGAPRTGSGLPEQLVVRARSLKDRQPFALSPNDQPVAGVGHVALPAARPASFEVVHAVPSAQLLERFRRVLGEQG